MTMTAPAVLTLQQLSDDETRTINANVNRLALCSTANQTKQAYYEGEARVRDLGISIPPNMLSINTVVGWPTTVVDVLDERCNLHGFGQPSEGDDLALGPIVTANHLLSEAPQSHVDAMIYGVSFIAVGKGRAGEPDPLVTFESPLTTTGIYDRRQRRLTSALTQQVDAETLEVKRVSLYLPDQTIIANKNKTGGGWTIEDRDEHKVGRVLVVRQVNRPRTSDVYGRSEITKAIRSYTDNAVRTLLGMEVAREFYGTPQRYFLGASQEAFQGPDGSTRTAWESYMGRMLALKAGQNDDGSEQSLTAGQFEGSSMSPYADQLRVLSELVATEAGMPTSYLGFTTENPPSADGTRALEARLVKRAERRIVSFAAAEVEAIELAVRIRDGEFPAPGVIRAQYGDPATPTQAATADAIVKQVAAGILPPNSDVTLQRLGYSPAERLAIKSGQ